MSFISSWRSPVSDSYKTGVMRMNSFCFSLFRQVFLSPIFLKHSFTGCGILGCPFFLFQYFKYTISSFLAWKFSFENSNHKFKFIGRKPPLTSHFYFAACKVISLIVDNVITMYLNVAFFGLNLFGILWASWIWVSFHLLKFGKISAITTLKILSGSF